MIINRLFIIIVLFFVNVNSKIISESTLNSCQGGTIQIAESIPLGLDISTNLSTHDAWMDLITNAQESIDLGFFYFTLLGGSDLDPVYGGQLGIDIFNAIVEAHSRGINVRIVQNEPSESFPDTETQTLAKLGIQVRSIDWVSLVGSGVLHTKLIIIDESSAYVGSANADWSSLAQVKELGIVLKNCPTMVADTEIAFQQYWNAADFTSLPINDWGSNYQALFNNTNMASLSLNNNNNNNNKNKEDYKVNSRKKDDKIQQEQQQQEQQQQEQQEQIDDQDTQQQEDEFVVLEETKPVEPIRPTPTLQETPQQQKQQTQEQEHEYQDIVQFIDHKGDIVKEDNKNGRTTFLSTLSNRDDFLTKGFDYSVISILGPQSSGKSTLLNLLFNTRFAVMDASTGRKQTTQGVWMGVASTTNNKNETFLILDVEGTDGRERGEDEKAFERKTSLFSLALSSVLIINMWAHDIGRYNAANISLLKTVFELNLQLFQKKRNHKILIFFLIRDHDGVTPLERLKATLMEDITKLWTDLQKPEEFVGTRESDFFDFEFTTLPHKIYSPTAFLGQVEQLKQRFSDSGADSFIPKRKYRNDDIPADGFYQFSYQVWETIKSNRDLDLPSQKEMLALYRCDEFVEQSMTQFTRDIKPIKEHIERGRIQEQFGEKSKRILDQSLSVYDEPAQRYHLETVQKKRQVLTDRILTELKYLFDKQMERLNENTLVFYNSLIKEFTDSNTGSSSGSGNNNNKKRDGSSVLLTAASVGIIPQFSTWSNGIKKKSIEYFEIVANQSIVPGSDWSFENDLEQLKIKIDKELSILKENQLVRLSKLMRDKTFQQELTPLLTKITEQAPNNMWQKIKTYYDDALSSNEKEFRDRLVDFQLDEQKVNELINKFREQLADGLKNKITERAEFLQMRMRKRFEEKFNMDNRNLPRKWTKTDDIASIFQDARQNAEKLIDLFSYLRLDEEDSNVSFFKRLDNDEHEENTMVNSSKIIIPYKDCCLACENFRLTIKSDYMQALSEQNRLTSGGGVPGYMIILLCVLGFNEFISIISSPLLLLLTILLGGVGFVLFKLGLAGPFIDYSSQILVHFISKVKDIVLHVEQLQEQNHNNNNNNNNTPKQKRE